MPKLDLYTFGRKLVETNDLDPIYCMLWQAKLEPDDLRRWLLGYWAFYHSGTASWLVDSQMAGYWTSFQQAAASKDYPRCRERRHFRGENARKSVEYLVSQGISRLFAPFSSTTDQPAKNLADVLKYVQTWVGFGPWIAFKVADMLERLAICPIKFDAKALYDSPREGAEELWDAHHRPLPRPANVVPWAVDTILRRLACVGSLTEPGKAKRYRLLAPPRYERLINVQEAETILCKWHSYLGGHYHIGEDLISLRKSLEFRPGPTAKRLLDAGKRAKLWKE